MKKDLASAEQTPCLAEVGEGASAALPDGGKSDHLGEAAPAMTEEEREAAAARERFLAEFQGDSMFLDDLAGDGGDGGARRRQGGAVGNGDAESGLISVGGSDVEEGEVDINKQNLRRGAQGQKAKKEDEVLGPEGAIPLKQVRAQQAGAAGLAGVDELTDAWADLGLERPAAHDDAAAEEAGAGAQEEEEVDAFAAFEELDPFAGFADLAGDDGGTGGGGAGDVLTAGNSINPQQTEAAAAAGTESGAEGPAGSRDVGEAGSEASTATAARAASAAAPDGTQQPPELTQAAQQQIDATDPTGVPGFREGVQAMFAGQWQAANAYFGQAFAACRDANAPRLRAAVAQYAAAVGILEAYAVVDERVAARLSRYAASLPLLLIDHLSILVNDAVGRNVRAGNYEWCKQALSGLGRHFVAIGQPGYVQNVGARLQQVQAAGVGDATVGEWESAQALVTRVNDAMSMQEINAAVASVKAGML
jgi:hypothetical protein